MSKLGLKHIPKTHYTNVGFSLFLKHLNAVKGDKTVTFTNGCFDVLHSGHLYALKEAAKYGDIFIVGLNSDMSVRNLKGEGRPIISDSNRAMLIEAYSFVDYILIFDEPTPTILLRAIRPEYFVKLLHSKAEKEIVESYGGKVVTHGSPYKVSTSRIIEKILKYDA